MFEHILLAVDGSGYSGKAVELAGALAKQFGSEVVVVHVSRARGGQAVSAETRVLVAR